MVNRRGTKKYKKRKRRTRKKRGQGGTQSKEKIQKKDDDKPVYSLSNTDKVREIIGKLIKDIEDKDNQMKEHKKKFKEALGSGWTSIGIDSTNEQLRFLSMYNDLEELKRSKSHYEKLLLYLETEEGRKQSPREAITHFNTLNPAFDLSNLTKTFGGRRRRKRRKKRTRKKRYKRN